MIVSGLTEADTASQIPPGRADDPSRRQTELNVSIIRPMKKILTTLTVIAATALGAQGQTTNTFYYGTPTTFTGLTLEGMTNSLVSGNPYTYATLLFRSSNVQYNSGDVLISEITLSGDGITGTLGFDNVTLVNNNLSAENYVQLTTPTTEWDTFNSRVGFKIEFRNGAIAPPTGSSFSYRVRYSADDEGNQVNTTFGNVGIVAVPEPSAYAAAAGLLALFLWSSRRHLFKLAGARSSASGSDENGAA